MDQKMWMGLQRVPKLRRKLGFSTARANATSSKIRQEREILPTVR
jgi:hypothetical protein